MGFDMAMSITHIQSGLHLRLPLLLRISDLRSSMSLRSIHTSPHLLLSARRKQTTLKAQSGRKTVLCKGKEDKHFRFCGLVVSVATIPLSLRHRCSRQQHTYWVSIQYRFYFLKQTAGWRAGLSVNTPFAMIVSTPCNMSTSDLYLWMTLD